MKSFSTLLFSLFLIGTLNAQLNMSLLANYTYSQESSDIWGYRHEPTGVEYAIVGLNEGTSIVSLENPTSPAEIAYFPGTTSIWRDIKTWRTYAYVVNDDGGGMDIIDFSPLPGDSPVKITLTQIAGLGTLSNCHNIYIDENGFAYLSGSNLNNGGVVILDLNGDPLAPTLAGIGPARYSHDSYARDNVLYSSDINDGILSILDVSDKANVAVLATRNTPARFTHNAWLSDDGNTIYTTEEIANAPVTSYDISNLDNIRELDQYRPYATLDEGVIPHNVHVLGDWLIISYYTDGCIIVDASRPDNMVEVGNFDTYAPNNAGLFGAWGAYPFLPSGLILVSDINTGLYVFEPDYIKAAYLEGTVRTSLTGNGLAGATLRILDTDVAAESVFSGILKTGYPIAGTYTAEVSHPTHQPTTIEIELVNGQVTPFDVTLEVREAYTVNGTVRDADSGETIQGAVVRMENQETGEGFETLSNPDGTYTFTNVFQGEYELIYGRWGYQTAFADQMVDAAVTQTLDLEPGLQDNFSLGLGWQVSGGATRGRFERGEPIQVVAPGGYPIIFPDQDFGDDDLGNACYVTANTSDLNTTLLANGTTIITSPRFDLSRYGEPEMAIVTWYFTANAVTYQPTDDALEISIDNGDTTVVLKSILYSGANLPFWEPHLFRLKDFIELTDDMRVSVTATSISTLNFTEAGVDFFELIDLDPPTSTQDPVLPQSTLRAFPNPSTTGFQVYYELPGSVDNGQLVVYNILGREVARYELDADRGQVAFAAETKGIYLAQIQVDGKVTRTIKLMGR
ncbi:MAG: choice-of-anchor B family protein [Bacteroidota bacterium]